MQSQPWNTIQIWKSSSWTIFQGIAWLNREFVQLLFTLQISKQEHNLQISFTTFKFPWQQTHSVYSHFLPPKNSTWGKCQLSEQFSLCYPPPFWTPKPETPWCVPWNCRGHAVSCGEVNLIQALDGHGKRQGPIFVMWFHGNLQPDLPYTKRGNLLGGNHPSSWKIKYNSLGLTAIHDLKPELVTEWKCLPVGCNVGFVQHERQIAARFSFWRSCCLFDKAFLRWFISMLLVLVPKILQKHLCYRQREQDGYHSFVDNTSLMPLTVSSPTTEKCSQLEDREQKKNPPVHDHIRKITEVICLQFALAQG